MARRNLHWTNRNEQRDYPLDDVATAITDSGERLPQSIIADLRLRYPALLGDYPFISAVTVTAGVATVLIEVATTMDNTAAVFTPLAAVSVPISELVEGRQYKLEAQYPGVGGWITFGSGTQAVFTGRFSTPNQTLLAARAVRPARSLPVTGLSVPYAATPLTGIVQLRGEDPVEVVSEQLEILGESRSVIVIRLKEEPGVTAIAGETSIFETFAGPCAQRPESKTCGDPQPIEFINNVAPDCNGVLTLEFLGCAIIGRNTDDCGIVLDCGYSLAETCIPPELPDENGLLPSEVEPRNVPEPEEPEEPEEPAESISEEIVVLGDLPYLEQFDDGVADNFVIHSGYWTFVSYDDEELLPWEGGESYSDSIAVHLSYSTEATSGAGSRNVSVWEGFDITTLYRQVMTDLYMIQGPAGAKHNGGIVLNLRPHDTIPTRDVYYFAVVDYDAQELRISRFNGTNYVTQTSIPVPGLRLDTWYRMLVEVQPSDDKLSVSITVTLYLAASYPSVLASLGPFSASQFMPADGHYGLGTQQAQTRFGYFWIDVLD